MQLQLVGRHFARLIAAVVAIAQVAIVATVLAAGSPQSDNAGAWPADSAWRAYTLYDAFSVDDDLRVLFRRDGATITLIAVGSDDEIY